MSQITNQFYKVGTHVWPQGVGYSPYLLFDHVSLYPYCTAVYLNFASRIKMELLTWPCILHDCLQAQSVPRKLKKPQRNPAPLTATKKGVVRATAATTSVKERMFVLSRVPPISDWLTLRLSVSIRTASLPQRERVGFPFFQCKAVLCLSLTSHSYTLYDSF